VYNKKNINESINKIHCESKNWTLFYLDIICKSYAQMKKGPVFYDSQCIYQRKQQ